MKRLLMIAFHFPPLAGSSGIQRTIGFARHLPRFDWEPLILTAHPRAYERVSAAYKLPREPAECAAARDAAIQAALMGAAEVPLETARACARVAQLAATCAKLGNSNAVSDAGVAALLAEAACKGAAYNVRINVSAMADKAAGKPLADEVTRLVHECASATIDAISAVELAISA